ncbi:helix-turn-helix transcriptional regulator [Actinoplanes palleronii]|uniref:Transcriptional regulator n=1 Tax=Actinoplanes palleronii TaxID=113570 RepID=A0ABQ4BP43_9ACTN|nr:helix-turn-helix transcriptional regulator [Actinoplanes palleronii]GIE72449.1 transcriptional regulator [Actinoplanes palleronii]
MDTTNALGDFLRARRAAVSPGDVGLPPGTRRRVPGLRREELAMLAGVSPDYYLRLEQGRDRRPSPQVIAALATALRLDEAAAAHLHGLAAPPARSTVRHRVQRVPAGTAQLVDQLPLPAYVVGSHFDVLTSNAMARALSPSFSRGRNLLRQLFLDPADQGLYLDWERITAELVAGLRSTTTADPGDPRLADLVGELSLRSERFSTLWARAEVSHGRDGVSHLDHPQVGELHLRHEKLDVGGRDGMQLVIHHAMPGTGSAQALALLGTLAATTEHEQSLATVTYDRGPDNR